MKWVISIFTADGKRLIFAAQASRTEIRELAAAARRQGPFKIFLRSPTGETTEHA